MPDTLRQMAESNAAVFELAGVPACLRAEAAHTVVRVAQEALTNAAKHAPGAARAARLSFAGGRITLAVANGAATAAPCPELAGGTGMGRVGMGLVGMRERVALLGETLRAGPQPSVLTPWWVKNRPPGSAWARPAAAEGIVRVSGR